ncbi:hypothetical protein [Tepidibacter formicigenes]|jgi:hypothetical protein|uniref:Uncharacterized protein n=1 Tax=Tepidibacter formicigenes DSM 15518 TaxID=1123349 RepID=A0A1M6N212_9FIRM|nr:hypothetical protein [Tepidibacter formicigenes]SHJ89673.1 hypothetical protein SAMN02744037_01138 [Tepidibacter formicigenes DSM 15518]
MSYNKKCDCNTSDCIDKIKTECIAVNKVFDSTIFKTQKDFEVCDQKFDIIVDKCLKPGDCLKIEKEKCKIEKFKITKVTTIINGETLSSTPIKQPGGIIDIDISDLDLDNKDCNKKGTEANITQKIKVNFEVKVTLKGKVLNSDSHFKARAKIKGSITFPVAVNLFIPSLDSAAKPFLSELCNASCKFTPCKLIVNNSCNLILDGVLTFCFICEKKVKVPVQICVLTTGLCQPKTENQIICDCYDFPKLFPKEIVNQFKSDCDLDFDCDCNCID